MRQGTTSYNADTRSGPGLIPTVNLQTAITYTFAASDGSAANGFVVATPAADATYTIPPDSSVNYAVYESIQGHNNSAFNVVIQGGSGVTFESITVPPNSGWYVYKTAANTWASFHANQGKLWTDLGTTYNSTPTDTSGVIPADNTIPQSTEGTEVMTVDVTPKSASSKLVVEVQAFVSEVSNVSNFAAVCIFRDSDLEPIAGGVAASGLAPSTNSLTHYAFNFKSDEIDSLAASSTTFKLRIGGDGASCSLNKVGGSARYGGKITSYIRVWEIT